MIKVAPSEHFIRHYRKLVKKSPEKKERIREKLLLFENSPEHPSLKNHKLTGELAGHFAISVEYDLRINIGTHDDVY